MYKKAAEYIKSKIDFSTDIGLILGSGLGSFADSIKNPIIVDYSEFEDFPVSTAPGHKGRFVAGRINEKNIICMQGRIHYYEGGTMSEVTEGVRVMKELGVKTLIITNAAGGINFDFEVGDIMVITDHINMMGTNPLIDPILEGEKRFPDMSFAYSKELISLVEKHFLKNNIRLQKGVYIGVTGPSYETPAEIKAYRILGADAVGMSTVPEVIVANALGIKVLGLSLITNMAAGVLDKPLTEEEVLLIGRQKATQFKALITDIISEIR